MNDNEIIGVLQDLWCYSKSDRYTEKEIREALDYAMRTIARVHRANAILRRESLTEDLNESPASAQTYEVIAYYKNGQCFATTGTDAVMNDKELKVKDKNGNITAIINRAEALAITCNKTREGAQ